jgi:hypothetical protein
MSTSEAEYMYFDNGLRMEPDGSIIKDKYVIAKVAIGLELYFWETQNKQQKRQAILDIFADYQKIVGPRLKWTTNPVSDTFKKLKGGINSYITPDQWVMDADDYGWGFSYHGGERETDASDVLFTVSVHGAETGYKGFSEIQCLFPEGTFTKARLDFVQVFAKWCAWLKPIQGYAGCFLAVPQDYIADPFIFDLEYHLSQQWPGLHINEEVEHFSQLSDGECIKGADWLTVLSTHLLDKLGGRTEVEEKMRNFRLRVQPYSDGLILVANSYPALGREGLAGDQLDGYYKVAAIVEPIRKKDYKAFHPMSISGKLNLQRMDLDVTRAWLARFSPKE